VVESGSILMHFSVLAASGCFVARADGEDEGGFGGTGAVGGGFSDAYISWDGELAWLYIWDLLVCCLLSVYLWGLFACMFCCEPQFGVFDFAVEVAACQFRFWFILFS